jgi:NAD(P)-dependent dehydrogenase (short-subunit alcohol dehydrogenase family)
MSKSKWDRSNIPNQKGKVIVITGATSGLGKEATKVLVEKGATIVMAVRNTQKAASVVKEIQKTFPDAIIDVRELDLISLKSVQDFADGILAAYNQLDILINNAGIMMCPYSKTEDGFEIQMGVNHLGHFALTGLLMPLLKQTKKSRVVATASIAHKSGNINFEDINWEKRKYATTKAYSDSKLANLYFAYELARKLKNEPNAPMIVAAHPGWTKTELDRHSGVVAFLSNMIAQTAEMGTLPTLRAAVDADLKSGDYIGPVKFMEMRGYPVVVKSNAMSYDTTKAKQLWDMSEEMTGVKY